MIKYLPFINVFLGFVNLGFFVVFLGQHPITSVINLLIGITCLGIGIAGIVSKR